MVSMLMKTDYSISGSLPSACEPFTNIIGLISILPLLIKKCTRFEFNSVNHFATTSGGFIVGVGGTSVYSCSSDTTAVSYGISGALISDLLYTPEGLCKKSVLSEAPKMFLSTDHLHHN
jgi:hypothetical protein